MNLATVTQMVSPKTFLKTAVVITSRRAPYVPVKTMSWAEFATLVNHFFGICNRITPWVAKIATVFDREPSDRSEFATQPMANALANRTWTRKTGFVKNVKMDFLL